MFKRLRSLFGLEKRLLGEVQSRLIATSGEIKAYCHANDSRFNDYAKLIDKMSMEFNQRMSRIEVLFSEELAAKEKARDILICEKRREAR